MDRFSLDDGVQAVRIARQTVDGQVRGQQTRARGFPKVPARFHEKGGAFVTLNTHPARELRGCIGIPEPVMPLLEAIIEGARSAATRDPRFPEVTPKELDAIVVEVSLLTRPEAIKVTKPADLLKAIVIGRDGLIAERGARRGLLLAQVPVEYHWSVEEFLAHTCTKAGLPGDAWADSRTTLYRFGGQVFHEELPRGKVVERQLTPSETA